MFHNIYPFAAIIGQDRLKRALILNLINPTLSGVLDLPPQNRST
jgi:magnesium chelatase subunit D